MKARPGWKTLPRLPFDIGRRTELSSGLFRLRFFVRERDRALVGYVRFGRLCAGPPGHAHGGMSAMVLDEAMGSAVWLKGYRAVAGRLEFDYHGMVPLGAVIDVEARARAARGRQIRVDCSLRSKGRLLVKGKGIFVRIPDAAVEKLIAGAR